MQFRLGLAAALVLAVTPLLPVDDAQAQRRGGRQSGIPEEGQKIPPPQQEKTFPLGNSWSLIEFNGKPARHTRATLQVDPNLRGTGFGGCNTFSASAYPLRQQGFAVGPMAVTKRDCDKASADFERGYLLALRSARQWDIVAGRLVLKTGNGQLVFDRGI